MIKTLSTCWLCSILTWFLFIQCILICPPQIESIEVGPTWSPCSAVVGIINVVQIIPSKSTGNKIWDIFTLQMILWKQYSYIAVIHVEIYRYAVFSSIFAVHQFFNFCRCWVRVNSKKKSNITLLYSYFNDKTYFVHEFKISIICPRV